MYYCSVLQAAETGELALTVSLCSLSHQRVTLHYCAAAAVSSEVLEGLEGGERRKMDRRRKKMRRLIL